MSKLSFESRHFKRISNKIKCVKESDNEKWKSLSSQKLNFAWFAISAIIKKYS